MILVFVSNLKMNEVFARCGLYLYVGLMDSISFLDLLIDFCFSLGGNLKLDNELDSLSSVGFVCE